MRKTETIARVFESYLGKKIDFQALSTTQAQHMLRRVRSLISEQRSSSSIYRSEKNPAYLKLMMMEQALSSHINEVGTTPMAIDVNDPKTKQIMQKAGNGQTLNPEEQQTMNAIALMKKEGKKAGAKRMVKESEIQQAQVVLASQDMLDRIQKMTEDISEMQFKDLPALTDSIKNDMGTEQATAYQAQASAALSTLLSALQQGKTQLEAAQGSITGADAGLAVPGTEDDLGADVDADVDAAALAAPDMGGDEEDISVDADIDAEIEPASSLGRDRRK